MTTPWRKPNGVLRPEFEALYYAIAVDREVDAVIVAGRAALRQRRRELAIVAAYPSWTSPQRRICFRIAGRDMA